MRRRWPCLLLLGLLLAGCQSVPEEPSARQRQDEAIADPFGFGPKLEQDTSRRSPISGGGIGEFDREGFKRDMRTVFDP